MPAGWMIKKEFKQYDKLASDFYEDTSKSFNKFKDLISELGITYLYLLKKKDLSSYKKHLNKSRKRRAHKVTKKSLKPGKVRKTFEHLTGKRYALQKINHLRKHGFEVTMNTFLERERTFLNDGSPYTAKIQCTPKRLYTMQFEFTNLYWQDWEECLKKYFQRVDSAKASMLDYFQCL